MKYLNHFPRNNNIAISNMSDEISFNELYDRVSNLILKYQDIPERSVIWVDCKNSIETMLLLLAFWEKNCCTIPIDPQMTEAEIAILYKTLPPNQILAQGDNSKIAHLKTVTDKNPEILDANTVQLSSGTTGEPKIILISNQSILFRALSNQQHLNLNSSDKTLCSVPLSHSHGIDCLALPALMGGGTLFITDPQTSFPNRILDWIEKYKITFFSSIPQMYNYFNQIFQQNQQTKKWDLSSLRYPFCGSAALSFETALEFNKNFNLKLNQGYGLAEIGVICVNLKKDADRYDSIGEPIPGIDWKITEDQELVVKSKALFSGYYKKIEETQKRLTADGYLLTEDLINVSNGFLYVVGRKNDFINVSGKKVYPKEIEDQLTKIQSIKEYCVTAESDPERGQVPVLHIVDSQNDQSKDESLILSVLNENLESYKIPKKIKWHKSFPKSPLGKILRSKL